MLKNKSFDLYLKKIFLITGCDSKQTVTMHIFYTLAAKKLILIL